MTNWFLNRIAWEHSRNLGASRTQQAKRELGSFPLRTQTAALEIYESKNIFESSERERIAGRRIYHGCFRLRSTTCFARAGRRKQLGEKAQLAEESPEHILLKDYRPKSTYKIPVTEIAKARSPIIAMRSHPYAKAPEQIAGWANNMDEVRDGRDPGARDQEACTDHVHCLPPRQSGLRFDAVGALFDRNPNLYADISARYAETAAIRALRLGQRFGSSSLRNPDSTLKCVSRRCCEDSRFARGKTTLKSAQVERKETQVSGGLPQTLTGSR